MCACNWQFGLLCVTAQKIKKNELSKKIDEH